MYGFTEKAIRGGICQVSGRYAEEKHDEAGKPLNHLAYLDANALYGSCMRSHLPTGGHLWGNPEEYTREKILAMPDDGPRGAFLEVDLAYPRELHDDHADYPLAPERGAPRYDDLSEYQRGLLREMHGDRRPQPSEKLLLTLRDKRNYVVHYRALKLYLSLGLVLQRVHRVLEHDQAPWLGAFIDFNADRRKNARNAFEKDFWKLMSNAVFGKTMEDVRKRIDGRLVDATNARAVRRLGSKRHLGEWSPINDDLLFATLKKQVVVLDKPIFCGAAILDQSKIVMYDFFYRKLRPAIPGARLLYSDTDSLIVDAPVPDVYDHVPAACFDFSEFPTSHPRHTMEGAREYGRFKDEGKGARLQRFYGIRAKMYFCAYEGSEMKKAKGIARTTVKKDLSEDNYRRAIFGEKAEDRRQVVTQVALRSNNNRIQLIEQHRSGLSAYDDKRYLTNSRTSLPYGHYSIAI